MNVKPIIFSAPMIRALLEGRKTQTRRVITPRNKAARTLFFEGWADSFILDPGNAEWRQAAHGFAPGDRLYVREAWRTGLAYDDLAPLEMGGEEQVLYEADGSTARWYRGSSEPGRYRHARFMPRWASRLTLTVTDVRVQRLQDISEADAHDEGVTHREHGGEFAREGFRTLWNSIHGPDAWDANPWVVALTFDVHRCNVDAMP